MKTTEHNAYLALKALGSPDYGRTHDGRFYASLSGVEIKDGGILSSPTGFADSIGAAELDLLDQLMEVDCFDNRRIVKRFAMDNGKSVRLHYFWNGDAFQVENVELLSW